MAAMLTWMNEIDVPEWCYSREVSRRSPQRRHRSHPRINLRMKLCHRIESAQRIEYVIHALRSVFEPMQCHRKGL